MNSEHEEGHEIPRINLNIGIYRFKPGNYPAMKMGKGCQPCKKNIYIYITFQERPNTLSKSHAMYVGIVF